MAEPTDNIELLMEIAGIDYDIAKSTLESFGNDLNRAIDMHLENVGQQQAAIPQGIATNRLFDSGSGMVSGNAGENVDKDWHNDGGNSGHGNVGNGGHDNINGGDGGAASNIADEVQVLFDSGQSCSNKRKHDDQQTSTLEGSSGASSSNRTNFKEADPENGTNLSGFVRAPFAPTRELMIDLAGDNFRIVRQRQNTTQNVVPMRNFQREGELAEEVIANATAWNQQSNPSKRLNSQAIDSSISAGTNSSNSQPQANKRRKLEDLFRPPFDICFNGTLTAAREYAKTQNKWLIINLQDYTTFESQVLNRDVWSNSNVKAIIEKIFVFWQIGVDNLEGARCKIFYKITLVPYIGIIDPRTGEHKYSSSDASKMTADHFRMEMLQFIEENRIFPEVDQCFDRNSPEFLQLFQTTKSPLDGNPLDDRNGSGKKSENLTLSAIDASEEEQLRLAIENSLQETQSNGKKTKNQDNDDTDDVDDDLDNSEDEIDEKNEQKIDKNSSNAEELDNQSVSSSSLNSSNSQSQHDNQSMSSSSINSSNSDDDFPLVNLDCGASSGKTDITRSDHNRPCCSEVCRQNQKKQELKRQLKLQQEQTRIILRLPNDTKDILHLPGHTTLKVLKRYIYDRYPEWTNDRVYKLLCVLPRGDVQQMNDSLTLLRAQLHPTSTLHFHHSD